MKNSNFNFIKLLISLFLVVTVCVAVYQVYHYMYKSIKSEYAVLIRTDEKISTTGLFARVEKEFNVSAGNYIDIVVENGEKISKGGKIANEYSNENSAKLQAQIRELESKIKDYELVISSSKDYDGNSTMYNDRINATILTLANSINKNDAIHAFENSQNFTKDVVKQKIAMGEITNYENVVSELKQEMEQLKGEITGTVKTINSADSGYFSDKVDGFESEINFETTELITINELRSQIERTMALEFSSNSIGKLVIGSDWRVCIILPFTDVVKYKAGDIIQIQIPTVSSGYIDCIIVRFERFDDEVLLVLESNIVFGNILSQRVCEIEVILNSFSGLRVDKNALRKIDGEDGVYVKSNGIIKYKKVTVLYLDTTYAVVKHDEFDNTGLKLYDEVIIRGSNLDSGKVVS